MDLVDRYFAAIRRNLPAAKASDIAAELKDDFCSHLEAREAELGRQLSAEELSGFIREFGHPLIVAARYRRHQGLIGPDVFPFYISVLRVVLLAISAVTAIVCAVSIATNNLPPVGALLQAAGNLASSALVSTAIVTLIFAVLERTGFPREHLERWKPETLPEAGDNQPGPWESAIEVALSFALLLWWIGLVPLPLKPGGPGFRIDAAPIWMELYWPILMLIVARLAHNLIQWLLPRWKAVRIVLGALTAAGAIVLLGLIYRAGVWVTVVPTGSHPADISSLQTSLDLAFKFAFVAVGVIWTVNSAIGLWRLARDSRERPVAA